MSLFDDEDIQLSNIEGFVMKKSIKDFLSNYCMAQRIFEEVPDCFGLDLASEIAKQEIIWRKPLSIKTKTNLAIHHITYNSDFFIEYSSKDGWVIYLLNCNSVVIRGKAGEIPDYIKFKTIDNEKIHVYLINCDLKDKSMVDVLNNGIDFIEYNAVKYT